MKACNFASLDPAQQVRGIRGLRGTSAADRDLWDQFHANPEAIAAEAEAAHEQLLQLPLPPGEGRSEGAYAPPSLPGRGRGRVAPDERPADPDRLIAAPAGPTETERLIRARRVQSFFRAAVLTSYHHRCAISGLAVPELLNASHIIPWSVDVGRRADPGNGICLNALYDRAFDRGLITLDEDLRVLVSDRLRRDDPWPLHRAVLVGIEGQRLQIPDRFAPDPAALAYHRANCYVSGVD